MQKTDIISSQFALNSRKHIHLSLLNNIKQKQIAYSGFPGAFAMGLQCMPIIFMTHWSFSVILSSHIGNPSEFASVMTNGPM